MGGTCNLSKEFLLKLSPVTDFVPFFLNLNRHLIIFSQPFPLRHCTRIAVKPAELARRLFPEMIHFQFSRDSVTQQRLLTKVFCSTIESRKQTRFDLSFRIFGQISNCKAIGGKKEYRYSHGTDGDLFVLPSEEYQVQTKPQLIHVGEGKSKKYSKYSKKFNKFTQCIILKALIFSHGDTYLTLLVYYRDQKAWERSKNKLCENASELSDRRKNQ